jgi:hypothetical protein
VEFPLGVGDRFREKRERSRQSAADRDGQFAGAPDILGDFPVQPGRHFVHFFAFSLVD